MLPAKQTANSISQSQDHALTSAPLCRVRESSIASYAEPPTPLDSLALTSPATSAAGTPAGPPVPKKPWQLLTPGEPFDPATAPEGATVRDQVRCFVIDGHGPCLAACMSPPVPHFEPPC